MASKRTLIVDDSLSTRMMTTSMLAKLCPDWSVVQAKDGSDALAKCAEDEFDNCLVDVNMPGIDGFELAALLREKYPTAHICMLTANIQTKIQERAAAAGFQFLAKPVSSEKLEMFISACEDSFRPVKTKTRRFASDGTD
jgi:CheY-like chemotaxis protein